MTVDAIRCELVEHRAPLFSECAAIRTEVFIEEQRVPPDEEMDELDAEAVHVLAYIGERPVGTGRLVILDDGSARIGRMAVRQPLRGRGVGSAILQRLMEAARERSVRRVVLAGQLHAIPFYERHGFAAHGDVFLDAGIEHRMMERSLD
jgi:predicted GNAT family N-acyltransferase